jgi:uncharacterized protein YjiS (DUF1127 family)
MTEPNPRSIIPADAGSLDSATRPIARVVARLVAALSDWCEREQLRQELGSLESNGELDRLFGDLGLSRDRISALLAGRTGSSLRLARMMRRRGIDPAALWAAGEMYDVEWRCNRCQASEQCEDWLAVDGVSADGLSFCPNTPTFDRLCAQQPISQWNARPAAVGETGTSCGFRGILAELDADGGQLL